MRDTDTIDSELRLLVAIRQMACRSRSRFDADIFRA
jgi:hypothetical protein